MAPQAAGHDRADDPLGQAILPAELDLRDPAGAVPSAQFHDLCLGDLRAGVGLPLPLRPARTVPAFADGVLHVLGVGTQPEVRRTDAARVVAAVADLKT